MQDVAIDSGRDGPTVLRELITAIDLAGPDPFPDREDDPEFAGGPETVSEQVTYVICAGQRIAAIVPVQVADEYLEDSLGVVLDEVDPA